MTWAQRLKRVFSIYLSVCPSCGGEAKLIVSVEDLPIIDKIFDHRIVEHQITIVVSSNLAVVGY
jgi:hypothetical protein